MFAEHWKAIAAMLTAASILSSGLTFVFTKLFDAYGMVKKYRLKTDAEDCMKEREKQEKKILAKLEEAQKRTILSNLMLLRLWKQSNIPTDEIREMERMIGVKVNPNDSK